MAETCPKCKQPITWTVMVMRATTLILVVLHMIQHN